MISPTGKTILLAPVRPNSGIEAEYRRRLMALIDDMHDSLLWWIGAAYKRNRPEIAGLAQDASPARTLDEVVRRLMRRWLDRFAELSMTLAEWFAGAAKDRSDASLRTALRRGGFSVRFGMTRATNDAYRAVIAENVGLIKSIAAHHLSQVQGLVMRSVQQGRNLAELATALEVQYGVTKRRAALIARDQNNKAAAVITRVRTQELGLTEAVWVHSAAGRKPRPAHVKAGRDRVRYRIAEGWYDPHEKKRIWPGELVNCRCVARAVIPGFNP